MVIVALFFCTNAAVAQANDTQNAQWLASCLTPDVCDLKSEITSNGVVAARVSVLKLRGYFLVQYTVPLGVDLGQGIFIQVDDGPLIASEASNCSAAGCTGTLTANSPLIQSLKQGNKLLIHFVSSQNQDSFAIAFTLTGFSSGFSSLTTNTN